MAKVPCVVCGRELGFLAGRAKLADGVVCTNCLNNVGISVLNNSTAYNSQSIKKIISERSSMVKSFNSTKAVGTYIQVDENNNLFKIGKDIFAYDNLLSFELLEDGQTITKGGLGRAVAGGLLFGSVGAVVGGITGSKKSKGICNSMKLRVSLKNAHTDVVYIDFISYETKVNGLSYRLSQDLAQKCITALETINEVNQNNRIEDASTSNSISVADEIVKFKALLDQGILTQEEFDAKKKELLKI